MEKTMPLNGKLVPGGITFQVIQGIVDRSWDRATLKSWGYTDAELTEMFTPRSAPIPVAAPAPLLAPKTTLIGTVAPADPGLVAETRKWVADEFGGNDSFPLFDLPTQRQLINIFSQMKATQARNRDRSLSGFYGQHLGDGTQQADLVEYANLDNKFRDTIQIARQNIKVWTEDMLRKAFPDGKYDLLSQDTKDAFKAVMQRNDSQEIEDFVAWKKPWTYDQLDAVFPLGEFNKLSDDDKLTYRKLKLIESSKQYQWSVLKTIPRSDYVKVQDAIQGWETLKSPTLNAEYTAGVKRWAAYDAGAQSIYQNIKSHPFGYAFEQATGISQAELNSSIVGVGSLGVVNGLDTSSLAQLDTYGKIGAAIGIAAFSIAGGAAAGAAIGASYTSAGAAVAGAAAKTVDNLATGGKVSAGDLVGAGVAVAGASTPALAEVADDALDIDPSVTQTVIGAGTKVVTGNTSGAVQQAAGEAINQSGIGGSMGFFDSIAGPIASAVGGAVSGVPFSDIGDYASQLGSGNVGDLISQGTDALGNLTASDVASGIQGALPPPRPPVNNVVPGPQVKLGQSKAALGVSGVVIAAALAYLLFL